MKQVEASAKTREEAIQNALRELGVEMYEVDKIAVLAEGSKGLFGLGARPCARLIVSCTTNPGGRRIRRFPPSGATEASPGRRTPGSRRTARNSQRQGPRRKPAETRDDRPQRADRADAPIARKGQRGERGPATEANGGRGRGRDRDRDRDSQPGRSRGGRPRQENSDPQDAARIATRNAATDRKGGAATVRTARPPG